MKRYLNIIIVTLLFAGFVACEDTWNSHYAKEPETVSQNVWDALKNDANVSKFVGLIDKYNLGDSLFNDTINDVYSLFVPSNEAIDQYLLKSEITKEDVAYHILKYYIQPNNFLGQRKIQTLMLKFAQFENKNEELFYDNIPVKFSSPLYENGRYFIIDAVASPKPSLYEYISLYTPALKDYIDEMDSIILDKELSKPLGFDENGNTIYDSVITVINLFEEEYFKVSEEFRLKTATLVFPTVDKYNAALDEMAINIGGDYTDHKDISVKWQQEVLIPYLLQKGVYNNQLDESEFQKYVLKNIIGDNIRLDFNAVDRFECSNGYAYDYEKFEIDDSLYLRPLRTEGESLLKVLGKDRFAWSDSIEVISDVTVVPDADNVNTASNDSILLINLPKNYEGKFTIEFNSEPLFPRRYLFVVRVHMDYGGIYDIYVNDELVKTFDFYDFVKYKGIIPSSLDGVRFKPDGRYNKFDFWVENITEYGKAKVRFEYKGPGLMRNHGMILDYLDCVTEEMSDSITVNP